MNKHLILGLLFILVGVILIIVSYTADPGSSKLVIMGTNISYGWLLLVLGGVRLFRSRSEG